ncbi:LSU ribosomal protein L10P [Desulfuromusa kysingii]|uniref:Large ribosomal subunit protein uL10 n=1 Tax=Desulfuromusa kysingii TaxID=37625 RepID=A0A1H4EG49_9BACT|nr:50S ribosomal protein L10 [Desulfuromusa kysingii]SEA83222.1 LSU ribosomal protein L10P [Desulfuromusa kysingii]
MDRTEKEQIVQNLTQRLADAPATFVADYRGINVEQATQLRRELTQVGVEYQVIKNSLLKLAAQGTPAEGLQPYCAGPTAIALSGSDPVAPAKILSKFAEEIDAFELKAGVLSGKLMSVAEISALAALPSREELLAKALSSMNAPVSNFVGTMAAMPRSLVQVLNAIGQSKAA